MDPEEKEQVESSTLRALELLQGSKKEHKKGIVALIKLTAKKEYTELAASTWMGEKGAAMTIDFLQNCNLEDESLQDLIDDHLKLLANVVRVEQFIPTLVNLSLIEALMHVLSFCPVRDVALRSLRVMGLASVDPSAVKLLVESNAMAAIMNLVSFKDDIFLTAVLPRLLKSDRMMKQFCENGGASFLHSVFVFDDEATPQALGGAVVAVNLMAKNSEAVQCMIREEEFVVCFVQQLSSKLLPPKAKVHVIRALYLIAQDSVGFTLMDAAVLPLMEIIEDRSPDALPGAVAAFDLLGLLCNTTDAIALVEEYGGESFVSYLLCFLASPKPAVVEPLCGLLHVLALGAHREAIVTAIQAALKSGSPLQELLTATLDLMGAGNSSSSSSSSSRQRAETALRRSATLQGEDLGTVARPERRATRESQTARQGAKRGNVIKEILSTERTYSLGLFSVCKCFIDPMKKLAAGPKPLVSANEIQALFGNIAEIYDCHKKLLSKFDQRVKANPQPNLADLFSTFADSVVALYRPYYDSYPKAVELIATKEKKTKGFRQLCTDLTKKIVRGGMSLENYLIMPIQRLPRYALLLRELEKVTLDVHPEKAALGAAAAKLEAKLAELDSPAPAPVKSVGKAATISKGASLPRGSAPEVSAPRSASVYVKPKLQENYSEPPAQLKVTVRKQRTASIARSLSQSAPNAGSRLSMIYNSPSKKAPPPSSESSDDEAPPSYMAPNPILSEGIVFEELGRDKHSVRKLVLLRDKLSVMTVPGSDTDHPSVFWESGPIELPSTVYAFPLGHLRMEKEGRLGLRLYDMRKPEDVGVVLSCETEQIVNAWIDVVFDAIYS